MYRPGQLDSSYQHLKSCQNSSVHTFFKQKYLIFSNKKIIKYHVGDITFHILDRIPLTNFVEVKKNFSSISVHIVFHTKSPRPIRLQNLIITHKSRKSHSTEEDK